MMIDPDFLYGNNSLNVQLFHAINNVQDLILQQLMLLGSALGKFSFFPIYLIIIAVWQRKVVGPANLKPIIVPMVITYIIFIVWVTGLKHFMHMPRPFAILPEGSVNILDSIKMSESPYVSFPSGHAGFSMMMMLILWPLLNRAAKIIGVLVLLWIGLSRINLGVHFPSDILMTWILSFAITTLSLVLGHKIVREAAATAATTEDSGNTKQ